MANKCHIMIIMIIIITIVMITINKQIIIITIMRDVKLYHTL